MSTKKTITIGRITRKPVPGKSFRRLGILPKDSKVWLSGFDGDWNSGWREGDIVEVEIQVVKKGDQTYYNIVSPPRESSARSAGPSYSDMMREIQGLRADIASLRSLVAGEKEGENGSASTTGDLPLPEDADIPF